MKSQLGLYHKLKSFQKYKKVITEFITNVISFSLLIVVQQIIALPVISRFYEVDLFGQIVLTFGISNIITSMLGFSIGNARLLDQKFYNYVYIKLFIISNILALIIGFFVYTLIFTNNYIEAILYAFVCMLGSIRYFFISEYRIKDEHKGIFKQNLYYFLGILLGMGVFSFSHIWLIIFLTAEVLSVIATYVSLRKDGFFESFKDKSYLKYTNTIQTMINNGLSYSLTQYDRFVIYPILGATNVSLYYSTSISARIGSLIMNPLSNFILGKLANKKENLKDRMVNMVILCSLIITFIYFSLTVFTTPILVNILYPSFLSKIEDLIIPICLGTAFMGGVSVLKPIIMKYQGVEYYNKVFLVYGVILITLSIFSSINSGLIGVAIAQVISSFILYIYLLLSLKLFRSKIII